MLSYNNKLIVLLILFCLSSCQKTTDGEFPDVGLERDKLNQDIEIVLLSSNTDEINKPVKLIVKLRSNVEVYTDSKFGARMFVLNNESNQWEEVYDPVTHYYLEEPKIDLDNLKAGAGELVLSANDADKLDQKMVILHPEIKSDDKSVKLLIVVSGNIYENGTVTDRKIGAYTITTLKP